MAKLTAEEKTQRALERKEAKRLEKQRAFAERVCLARTATHSLMDEKQLKLFLKHVDLFSTDRTKLSSIEQSIITQYFAYGKLSINQINVILKKAEEQKKLKFEQELFEEFENVNDLQNLKLKLVSIEEVQEQTIYAYGQINTSHHIKFVNAFNQHFKIKTNSKKILNVFSEDYEKLVGKWFNVFGFISWMSENKQYVNLSSKQLTIEVYKN